MDLQFLKELGINEKDPERVIEELGDKYITYNDQYNLAQSEEKKQEIKNILEKIEFEKEIAKQEAKNHIKEEKKKDPQKEEKKQEKALKDEAYKEFKKSQNKGKSGGQVLTLSALKAAKANQTANSTQQGQPSPAAVTTQSQNNTTGKNVTSTNSNTTTGNSTTRGNTSGTASVVSSSNTSSNKGATAVTDTQKNQSDSTAYSAEFTKALKDYTSGDYVNAFKEAYTIAEKKQCNSKTEEKERYTAAYLLAMMYEKGEGTTVDKDKSRHYLRRSADFGYDRAQLDYGIQILSEQASAVTPDMKKRKEGLGYLEAAADAGLVDAMKKYVDFAKNSSDSDKHTISKAKKYIEKMRPQLDSFEAQKCDDWLNEVKQAERDLKKKSSYIWKFIIGDILFLIGTIYLFKGLNSSFFEKTIPQVSKYIPDIPENLIIKWDGLKSLMNQYMTDQGIFGCWIIILGNLIRTLGAGHIPVKSKTKRVGNVINFLIVLICIAHFVANGIEGSGFFGNGSYMQFVAMIGSIVVGRILGLIIHKIIK